MEQQKPIRIWKPQAVSPSTDAIWIGDEFGRKEFAQNLSRLLGSTDRPLSIALDAEYGSGKTFLFDRLKLQLAEDGFATLGFNAWQTDHAADPLVAFIAILAHQLEASPESLDGKGKAVQLVKRGGSILLRRVLPGVLKAASAGAIDVTTIMADMQAEKILDDSLGSIADGLLSDIMQRFLDVEQSVSAFKAALYEAHRVLTVDKKHKSIVVLIDELDRCRPNYAISILETIKHFFDVPGYIFVVATYKEQLAQAIRAVYGAGFDGRAYLRRFFDYELMLPSPDMSAFAKQLIMQSAASDYEHDAKTLDQIATVWALVARKRDMPARNQQQAFSLFDLTIRTSSIPSLFRPGFAIFIIMHYDGFEFPIRGDYYDSLVRWTVEDVNICLAAILGLSSRRFWHVTSVSMVGTQAYLEKVFQSRLIHVR